MQWRLPATGESAGDAVVAHQPEPQNGLPRESRRSNAAGDIVEMGNGYFLSCRAEVGREGWWRKFLQGQPVEGVLRRSGMHVDAHKRVPNSHQVVS